MTRLLTLLLILASAAGTAIGPSPSLSSAQQPYVLKPTCTDSLQVLLDTAVPGSVLPVRTDCIYREDVVVGLPMILDGQGGAEIRGSDIWSSWIPFDGLWVSADVVPPLDAEGICDTESDGRCLLPEQVFRDGVALRQVPTGGIPGPGEFSLNVRRQVVVADDPTIATMEVSVRNRWMRIQADNVTIQGFTMRHASSAAQHGAVRIDNVTGWVVRDNVLSDAHGANLYYRDTSNGQLLDNEIFNAGQLGFGGRGSDILIQWNSVHNNNTEDFSSDWEAGGAKITETTGLVVNENQFFMNNGPGFWCDIDCSSVTISNNVVYNNFRVGIFFEISDGAEIFGNIVWENTAGPDDRGWAGIFISSSRNANVHDNVVAWNGNGIEVISQCRAFLPDGVTCDLANPWNSVYGNEIHGNAIIMGRHGDETSDILALGWLRDIVDADGEPVTFMFTPEANNRGHDNVYWIPEDGDDPVIGYSWGDENYEDLDAFNATPGEENGRLLDDAERDQILNENGIPLEPEASAGTRILPLHPHVDAHIRPGGLYAMNELPRWMGSGASRSNTIREVTERFGDTIDELQRRREPIHETYPYRPDEYYRADRHEPCRRPRARCGRAGGGPNGGSAFPDGRHPHPDHRWSRGLAEPGPRLRPA